MTINNNCGACGQCYETCPFDAIDIVKTKGYSNFVIDQKKCCGCGGCKSVCPSDAIND